MDYVYELEEILIAGFFCNIMYACVCVFDHFKLLLGSYSVSKSRRRNSNLAYMSNINYGKKMLSYASTLNTFVGNVFLSSG